MPKTEKRKRWLHPGRLREFRLVAMETEVGDDEKYGALKREIIGECL